MTGPLVITDLDGSLWDASLVVDSPTQEALAELERRGCPILVATGRRENSARRGLVANDLLFPAVLLNGAVGIELTDDDHRFHQVAFDPAEAGLLLDTLAAQSLAPIVYLADGRVWSPDIPHTDPQHLRNLGDELIEGPADAVLAAHAILGFSMLGQPREQLAAAVAAMQRVSRADIQFYSDHLYPDWSVMVQPPGINKQVGIDAWLAHRGFKPDRVIAIGDGSNDLTMLEAADVAVGVEGGDAGVARIADVMIGPPGTGGWADVLDLL